ncbi:MAG: DUF2271 domain-containing protein [Peptococcaceae bacterium]|jgi:hypothetical protein|nr:DUF2271 domain-containing protein [Peptococcaceae bacterium]
MKNKCLLTVVMIVLLSYLCACAGSAKSNEAPAPASGSPQPAATSPAPPAAQGTAPDAPPTAQGTMPDAPPAAQSTASDVSSTVSGEVTVTLDFLKQSGSASNQYAVWIEDMDGILVKTLFATKFTVNGGYKNRPDSIALWVGKSGIATMTKAEVDAVTSATPGNGTHAYVWDLTDVGGEAVPPGAYRILVEGTLRWRNSVLYTAVIEIGDAPATVQPEAVYTYEATDRNGALTTDSVENKMISNVAIRFEP